MVTAGLRPPERRVWPLFQRAPIKSAERAKLRRSHVARAAFVASAELGVAPLPPAAASISLAGALATLAL